MVNDDTNSNADGFSESLVTQAVAMGRAQFMRNLGVDHQPHELLKNVQDLEVIDLPNATECCGFGGLFAIKMGDISSAMLQRKLDAIESTGSEAVVGCDVSCLLNIGGGLHRRGSKIETKYIAELLLDTDQHG